MQTKFGEVFGAFLNRINDYDYANKLSKEDLDYVLTTFLESSVATFNEASGEEYDDFLLNKEAKMFDRELKRIEIDILAHLMVVEYLKPNLYTTELLRQVLSDRDYKVYSQANQMNQLKDLYELTKREANVKMNNYLFNRLVVRAK
ncbi:hypothetical protein [Enterococcus casseliflavus]|uniref:hypothetical protein n=1 Tax=Enterococcus casseliflavus TaxID=37734 RepID=UPI003018D2B8